MPTLIPVILCGGAGTRLWPLSRESRAKQFWPLTTDRSLLQETVLRAHGPGFAPPIIVCNEAHRFVVAEQVRDAGIADARIILEPVGRNSAPAVAAAALLTAEDDPDAVLWMKPADHAVDAVGRLHEHLRDAVDAARAGYIVTFGIQPTAPETGYGYIELGDPLSDITRVHHVARFVEKPDAATALELVASGRHLWNSGMFVFTARSLLDQLAIHAPSVLAAVRAAVTARRTDPDFIRLDPTDFAACPSISLDYAVAERTGKAAVIPADLGWSDIGSWAALWELGEKDTRGNVVVGDAILESAENCYVRSDCALTAVVGLSDVVLVVTQDVVMAVHRGRAQEVKTIVDRLKAAGRPEAHTHKPTATAGDTRDERSS
jgi:mannose-1-phosphate guanylyltransferase / mannose-6-phosphate isomerase